MRRGCKSIDIHPSPFVSTWGLQIKFFDQYWCRWKCDKEQKSAEAVTDRMPCLGCHLWRLCCEPRAVCCSCCCGKFYALGRMESWDPKRESTWVPSRDKKAWSALSTVERERRITHKIPWRATPGGRGSAMLNQAWMLMVKPTTCRTQDTDQLYPPRSRKGKWQRPQGGENGTSGRYGAQLTEGVEFPNEQ